VIATQHPDPVVDLHLDHALIGFFGGDSRAHRVDSAVAPRDLDDQPHALQFIWQGRKEV
jgi:hypothetical protein